MSVDHHIFAQRNLIHDHWIPGKNCRITHDFPKSQNSVMIFPLLHIFCRKIGSICLKRSCRNRRRHHHINAQWNILSRFQNIFHSLIAFDIDQFVRIRNNRCCPVGHNGPGKFQRCGHAGLNMHMGVNKSRNNTSPMKIHFFAVYRGSLLFLTDPLNDSILHNHRIRIRQIIIGSKNLSMDIHT